MLICPHCRGSLNADRATGDYQLRPEIEFMIDKMGLEELRRDYKITFVNQQNAERNLIDLKASLHSFGRLLLDEE